MKAAIGGRRSALGARVFSLFCLLLAAFGSPGCSLPNLEEPECTAARGAVKEFYSYHFGNEMRFSPETLKQRERFLTPELAASLAGAPPDADPFTTASTDYPKAFRVGGCRVLEAAKADVEVLLFWKDDERSEQRTIRVETVRRGEKWLVNRITN